MTRFPRCSAKRSTVSHLQRGHGSGLLLTSSAIQLGLIRTLRGLTPKFDSFNDAQFDEVRIERRLTGDPGLARAEFSYWISQAAGALSRRRLCVGRGGRIEGAIAALDSELRCRSGGVSVLRGALPRCRLRHRWARPMPAAPRGSGCSSPAARSLGGELPGEFRRTAPRWSAPRSLASTAATFDADAPLRTGHPLGPRQRLCSQ